MKKA
jgi:hypothetical protein